MEIFYIKFKIFQEELDLLWIIESQRSKKSRNEHFGVNLQIDEPNDIQILQLKYEGKLTTRGFQRDQNYQISPCILKVIAQVNTQIRIENEQ